MEITINVLDDRTTKQFEKLTGNWDKRLKMSFFHGMTLLRNKIAAAISGPILKVRSGRLRGSIEPSVRMGKDGRVIGVVGSNLKYARVQEEGAKINVSRRMAKFAWFKYFKTGEMMWKAIALLKGRQIVIPPKWYMKDTTKENINKVVDKIQEVLFAL